MRLLSILLLGCLSLLVVSLQGQSAVDLEEIEPGVVWVKFKAGHEPAAGIPEAWQRLRPESLERAFPFLQSPELPGAAGLMRVYTLRYDLPWSPQQVAAWLSRDPAVAYAEPWYRYRLHAVPDDPQYGNMPQFDRVEAEAAWDILKGEAGEVTIAILDGGTDVTHPDLAANAWTNPGEIPNNGVDDDQNGLIDDYYGWNFSNGSGNPIGLQELPSNARHGTHVAGTAAAVNDNDEGVASLSWNCRFLSVNTSHPVLDRFISYGTHGIIYAALQQAEVINCSWGGGGYSQVMAEAVAFAYHNGSLVVAAAGNNRRDLDDQPFYPACYPHVLSVGATFDENDALASFSNSGYAVDVYAPGWAIRSTAPNNTYATLFGTSMASPMVAALAGLLRTQHPDWWPNQVAAHIRHTTDDIRTANADSIRGLETTGRINARRALQATASPAIDLLAFDARNQAGATELFPGDEVSLTLQLVNHFDPARDLRFTLRTPEERAEVLVGSGSAPGLNAGESLFLDFQLRTENGPGQPPLQRVPLILEVEAADGYHDHLWFELRLAPELGESPAFVTLEANRLRASVAKGGTLGWVDRRGSAGEGIRLDGINYLVEAGLVVGQGNQVWSAVPTDPAARSLPLAQPLEKYRSGLFGEVSAVSYQLAGLPAFLSLDQTAYTQLPDSPALEQSLMLTYEWANAGTVPVTDLYLGLYAHWEWPGTQGSTAYWDQSLGTLVVEGEFGPLLGLTTFGGAQDFTVGGLNPETTAGGISGETWGRLLATGHERQAWERETGITWAAAGPMAVPAFGSTSSSLLITLADDIGALSEAVAAARSFYATWYVATEPVPSVWTPQPRRVYAQPNPAPPGRGFWVYEITQPGQMSLRLLSPDGRLVDTLDEGPREAGLYRLGWQDLNLAAGLYLLQLVAPDGVYTGKVVVE